MFKKECIERYLMEVDDRITMGDDAACVYPSILHAHGIYILNECLYHYRQSNYSLVKQNPNTDLMRLRFSILYHSVLNQFENGKEIYDLRQQWKQYLLFLMVPRAESLYCGIDQLDYLFPFPKVKRDSSIILYGMGTYGQLLYGFIKRSGICEIVACADRNYIALNHQGWNVISPNEITGYEYDYIVVASSFAKARRAILTDLSQKYDSDKIQFMDEKLIGSDQTLKALGLSDENYARCLQFVTIL